MLSFTGSLRVFLAVEPADMRKGLEGLHALVSQRLSEDVRGGALFVFINQRHTRLKVLYFDGTGLWLLTKRLEEGTFAWLKREDRRGETGVAAGGVGDAHRRHRSAGSKAAAVVCARVITAGKQ